MGNIRRDLLKGKPVTTPKPIEQVEIVDAKTKIKNLKKSTKNYQINTLFKANVVYALETLAERLSMERCDIIRLAVEDYLLHSSIQELLGNKLEVKRKMKRSVAQPMGCKKQTCVLLNIESFEIMAQIRKDEFISRNFLIMQAIDSYTKPSELINRKKYPSSFRRFNAYLPIDTIKKLDDLAAKENVSRSCMLREIIETFIIDMTTVK